MIIFFWFSFLIPLNLLASNFPDIFGCFCEGGIITGRLESKDKLITIDGKRIRVSEEGDFIFAFGRKFKESITISVNGKNKKYKIKDKTYKKEIIRGLPSRKVEPNKEDIKKIQSDQKKIKSPIIKIILAWCLDDSGRNVLYKSNGKERYPDFKLYKMIARSVHNHVPSKVLENEWFHKYIISKKKITKNKSILNIDNIPEY